MKCFHIKAHQYYRQNEIDMDVLMGTLPYCVKIVSSKEEEMNDIIKLEFDRSNCIPLSEVIKYTALIHFRLSIGQVFILIHKLLCLIENLKYENENINQYHIWLIFNQDNNQKLEFHKRSILDFQLFYSFPLLTKGKQDKTLIIDLITKILKLCENIPQSYCFFDSKKPYKVLEKELKLGFYQFKQKFNDYYQNQNNINQQTQMDLNIDIKDEYIIEDKDLQKIEMFISDYTQQNYYLQSPLDAMLIELLKQYQLELHLKSLSMHEDKMNNKNKYYELVHFKRIFKFESEQQLITVIQETFENLNQIQEIFRNPVTYEDHQLTKENLKDIYESASVIYFKHQGYFNSIDQFIEIREQIITKQFIFENNFHYILKPIISEYFSQIVELMCLNQANDIF